MKRKTNRLHSEDARMLREMVLSIHAQVTELESALGHIQRILNLDRDVTGLDEGVNAEILEVA